MLKNKIEKLTIEDFLNNEKVFKTYLKLLKDESLPEEVYTELISLMRSSFFLHKAVVILGSILVKQGGMDITPDGEIKVKDDKLSEDEVFALTEAFTFIKDFREYEKPINDEQVELLSYLVYLDTVQEFSKQVRQDNDIQDDVQDFDVDSREVQ